MSKQTKEIMMSAYQDSLIHVRRYVKEGDTVTWKNGKFEGRKALVRNICIDVDGDVHLWVKTQAKTKDKKGEVQYLDEWDYHHRQGWTPASFGIELP